MTRLKRLKNILYWNYLNKLEKHAILTNHSRLLRKKIVAEWKPVNINSPELIQSLTNAMTYNSTIRINYRNSGWRTILPYGWNTSKEGNTLVMCYKDTGEIRSYRIDRIFDVLINTDIENYSQDQNTSLTWEDFQMPTLPNLDKIIQETEAEVEEQLPYDLGLQVLTTNQLPSQNEINESVQNQDGEDINDINIPLDEINEKSEVKEEIEDEEKSDESSVDEEEQEAKDDNEKDNDEQIIDEGENQPENKDESDKEEKDEIDDMGDIDLEDLDFDIGENAEEEKEEES